MYKIYKQKKGDHPFGIAMDIGRFFYGYIEARSREEAIKKIQKIAKIAEKEGVFLGLKLDNGADILA